MPPLRHLPAPALLRRAARMLPAVVLAWNAAAAASPLEQEPPARMVPVCFAHLDNAIAKLRGSDGASKDTAALYRGREVLRDWMRRHGAVQTREAGNATQDDLDFCLRIGAVMFQFAKPPESEAIVGQANAAQAADAAHPPARDKR